MKATKTISMVAVMALLALAFTGVASAISVTINEVQVDDTTVTVGSTNRLDLTRDAEFEVEVRLTAQEAVKDMEVQAFVSGYEYNSGDDRLSSTTALFDAAANVTYVKKLHIKLPDNVERDDYLLRVIATNRNDVELIQNYRLKLDVTRHELKIKDVLFSPAYEIKAGAALLTTVRVENQGERTEKDIKVTVSVPDLGLSATDYIDEIKSVDNEKETEEIYLRMPKCAKPGAYQVKVDLSYNEGHSSVSASRTMQVVEDDSCRPVVQPTVVVQTVQPVEQPKVEKASSVRNALEIALLVLVGILVIIGLIIGFSKLKGDED